MLLADFGDKEEAALWQPTDDVVMGGRSSSAMLAGDGVGIFCGELSLEGGGGFASVRRRMDPIDRSAHGALELRVRGDGRRYKLNLRVSGSPLGLAYQAAFETRKGSWITAALQLAEFAPRFRGQPAEGALDRSKVSSLGLLISDRQVGPFRLELSSIAAAMGEG